MAETSGRILIVDDEPSLLIVMEQYLGRLGYQVTACRSGHEAWKLFEADPAAYSLVIADIMMPKMSGVQLLTQLFERNPDVRVLVCSGYPYDPTSIPAEARPSVRFLQKPFAPQMLAEAVRRIFEEQ